MKQHYRLRLWISFSVLFLLLNDNKGQVEYTPSSMTLEEASKYTTEQHFVYRVDIEDYYSQLREVPRAKKAKLSDWGIINLTIGGW
jgi:hypothetical protein